MWYSKITENLDAVPDFLNYYNNELITARKEIKIYGSLEKAIAALPGIVETRFSELQEIEAVLEYLNLQLRKISRKHFKLYLEGYAKALTSRDAEKYAEGEEEVIDFECLILEVSLLRNRYLGIIKGLEQKSFSISNISKLRTAGMEDVTI